MDKQKEVKWFTTEKERLAYLRGQNKEYKLKPVEKGYQLLIYLVNGQILDGGIYQKKHYQQLTEMIPKVLEQRQNSQVQSATVFGKPIDKKEA